MCRKRRKGMDTTSETRWAFLYQNSVLITKVTTKWSLLSWLWSPNYRIIKVLWWHKQHESRRLTIWAKFRFFLESKIIIQVFFRFFENDQSSMQIKRRTVQVNRLWALHIFSKKSHPPSFWFQQMAVPPT